MVSKDDFIVGLKWIVAWIVARYTELSPPVQLLGFFILVDSVTGSIATLKEGRGLCSAAGAFGLSKKLALVIMLFTAWRLRISLGVDYGIVRLLTFLFLWNEWISIMENCARLNPASVPPGLLSAVHLLQKSQRLRFTQRVNRALAVFFDVDPTEVRKGKFIGKATPSEDADRNQDGPTYTAP